MRIEIKPKYGHDAFDRGLDIGTYITENKAVMVLECTDEQLDELRSDAEHYATPGQFGPEYRGLVASAKASLKLIEESTNPYVALSRLVDKHKRLYQAAKVSKMDSGKSLDEYFEAEE